MCELFAFSGAQPAQLEFELREFARHSDDKRHAQGWGVAHYVDGDVRLLKEPVAASGSACADFLDHHPLLSPLVLSHIRRATQGATAMRNCQPFVRELGGAMHVFAHNGDLDRGALARRFSGDGFRPVGETDSELAFCVLLDGLRPLWRDAAPPPLAARARVVAAFAEAMRALGPANFVYADGDALFAHGHRRTQADRGIRPPGLHLLCRACGDPQAALDVQGVRIVPPAHAAAAADPQTLVASVPLTADSAWRPLAEGEVIVVRDGSVV